MGPKSKHTQFSKMCNDPSNDKFKVEKEADLQVSVFMFNFKIIKKGILGCNGSTIH